MDQQRRSDRPAGTLTDAGEAAAPSSVTDPVHGRLAGLADVLLEPLLALDADWRVVFANAAAEQLLGRAAAELVGRACADVLPDLRAAGALEPLHEARREGQPRRWELHFASLDRWLRLTGYPLDDWLAIQLRDLTRERAEAAEHEQLLRQEHDAREVAEASYHTIDEANRAKSEFLAVMSHELRTPLTAIQGYVQLLQLGVHGSITEQQRRTLDRVESAQRHLMDLINDVLLHARLEAGRVRYDMTDVPLPQILSSVETVVAPQAVAKQLTLAVGECADEEQVRTDRNKLVQVLVNLIANAIKFTDAGGEVAVRCLPRGAQMRIEVHDTGVGIPAEMLDSVFEPFVQVDKRLTRRHEGVGLGLAISRDLVREMGGDLTAESTLGGGSVFTVTVPRTRPSGSQRRAERRARSDRRTGEDRRSGEERRAN